jgi:hypothetical protein
VQFVEASELKLATCLSFCNGFFTRILNNQMSAIDYVLLSNDICSGVKRVTIDEEGLFDIHSDHIIIRIVFNTGLIQRGNKKVVSGPQFYWKINEETDWPMLQECLKISLRILNLITRMLLMI